MAKLDWKIFAPLGAQHRVQQIRNEIAEIVRHFPDLAAPRREARTAYPPNELAALGGRQVRQRSKMSVAQRKAVGERMRRYWAARKAAATRKKR